MREQLKSSLSSLLDDEADDLEVRRVLKEMDDEGTRTWSRYQLIRAVLKNERPEPQLDLSAGVMAALAAEPAHQVSAMRPAGQRLAAYLKPFGSLAVAASVTAIVIFGSQHYMGTEMSQAAEPEMVLASPTPVSSALQPARFGTQENYPAHQRVPEQDVIRLSTGLEHYILQHHNLLNPGMKMWSTSWLPDGYMPARHEMSGQAEVMMYSNGASSISVSVEPYGQQKSPSGVAHVGDTVALGKRVGDQFVTVVGDVPLMIAERIASSVKPLPK